MRVVMSSESLVENEALAGGSNGSDTPPGPSSQAALSHNIHTHHKKNLSSRRSPFYNLCVLSLFLILPILISLMRHNTYHREFHQMSQKIIREDSCRVKDERYRIFERQSVPYGTCKHVVSIPITENGSKEARKYLSERIFFWFPSVIRRSIIWLNRVVVGEITIENGKYLSHIQLKGNDVNERNVGISSLCLDIDPKQPIRVNILFHGLENEIVKRNGFYAGAQGILRMAESILKIQDKYSKSLKIVPRIIDIQRDHKPYDKFLKSDPLRKGLEHNMDFGSFTDFWDRVDVFWAGDITIPIPVSPHDVFVAGYWPTAYLAHRAMRDLGKTHFIYLISDFEPMFYSASSKYALALQTYSLPHYAVTNTPTMLRTLKSQIYSSIQSMNGGITEGSARSDGGDEVGKAGSGSGMETGIASSDSSTANLGSTTKGGTNSPATTTSPVASSLESTVTPLTLALKHPIQDLRVHDRRIKSRIEKTKTRRVLIYSRDVPRNALDLVFEFLNQLTEDGVFSESVTGHRWVFHGMGENQVSPHIHPVFHYKHLGSIERSQYSTLLSKYDIGISLMLSPNINFAQIEFAAAGMITIVNDYLGLKTVKDYNEISSNFEVAKPTITSLVEAVRRAIPRVEDVNARIEGARNLDWPRNHKNSFSDAALHTYEQMILESMHCRYAQYED